MKTKRVYVVQTDTYTQGRVIGVFTDRATAALVARTQNGYYNEIVLDAIFPGYVDFIKVLGLGDQLPEEYR